MEKIGTKETSHLFAILIISTVTLNSISGFVRNSGTAAYINSSITLVLTIAALWIVNPAFKKSDLPDVLSSVYGKYASLSLMCILFVLTICNASVRLDMFAHAVGKYILTDTPKAVILAVIALCAFFVCFFGMEAITRYSLVTFIAFAGFLLIMLLSSASEVKVINMYPLLGKGDFDSVLSMMYVFADILYLYLLSAGVRAGRTALGAAFLGGGVTVVLTLFYVLCVPYPVSQYHEYPLYTLASLSNSSVIFQRMDGLVFIIWMLSAFISVGALSLFATEIFARAFSLTDRKALSAPVVFLVFLISMWGMLPSGGVQAAMAFACFVFLPVTAVIYRITKRYRGGKNA